MRKLLFCIALFPLSGCVSMDEKTCAGYGYSRGTSEFASCMMTVDQSRRARLSALGDTMIQQSSQQPSFSRPTQTVCQPPMGPNMPMVCTTQ